MSLKALHIWCSERRPDLACALDYAISLQEVRATMNHATGLDIPADFEVDEAAKCYLDALNRDN